MTNLNNKFTNATTDSKKHGALNGTATLTAQASVVVTDIFDKLDANFEAYADLFEDSKLKHSSMDELINKLTNNLDDYDISFVDAFDDADITQMLKSQASKRSRLKGKEMTMDNYANMLNAAVSEDMLRKAIGKAKAAGRHGVSHGYSDEYVEALLEDQNEIRRELRNIQSKQCSLRKKHPDDYAELDEYKKLEEVAETLKASRVASNAPRVSKLNNIKEALNVDAENLDLAEALELLNTIKTMAGGDK